MNKMIVYRDNGMRTVPQIRAFYFFRACKYHCVFNGCTGMKPLLSAGQYTWQSAGHVGPMGRARPHNGDKRTMVDFPAARVSAERRIDMHILCNRSSTAETVTRPAAGESRNCCCL